MRNNMFRKLLVIILILAFGAGSVYADVSQRTPAKKPFTINKVSGFNDPAPAPDGLSIRGLSLNTDDPLGEVYVVGTTWYDIQHNSTCGRQIYTDASNNTHIVWMNGLNNGASQRHIFYEWFDAAGNPSFGGGVPVESYDRTGYTDLTHDPEGRALPCYHRNQDATYWFTVFSFDFFPYIGAFQSVEAPHVFVSGTELSVGWPKVDVDRNGRYHILSTENPLSGTAGDPQRQYYIQATLDQTPSLSFTGNQEEIAWTETISGTVAASPVSDKVAIAYLKPWATDSSVTTQNDNDLILLISEDGITWDWSDTINVTNWIEPRDLSVQPDTVLADMDTLRCYAEINVIIDYNDIIHIFFTTEGYYHYEQGILYDGYVWHWDEVNEVFSMVADGFFEYVANFEPGAWNRYLDRPQAAIDTLTGDIYCMYQRYLNPTGYSTTLPFPYQTGDTTDISQGNFANGEIWITKSTDNGYTWAEGTNITNTPSPGASAGSCLSELTPSMAPYISEGACHVFYILDADAGCVIQNEGGWTLNNVIYQKVPVELIADSPLLPPYPMHVDSTGMPLAVEEHGNQVVPAEFSMMKVYPNPFNPATTISFEMGNASLVSLRVFDVQGREVDCLKYGQLAAGKHEFTFDASGLSSGIYFAKLEAGDYQKTVKLLLMK